MDGSAWPFVFVVAGLAAFHLASYRRTSGRSHQALWGAFSTTFGAVLFIGTGSIGFALQKGPALFSSARWTGGVIWPQVALGVVFLVAAVFFWRKAIRDTDRLLNRA